jgi:hypothetical protein
MTMTTMSEEGQRALWIGLERDVPRRARPGARRASGAGTRRKTRARHSKHRAGRIPAVAGEGWGSPEASSPLAGRARSRCDGARRRPNPEKADRFRAPEPGRIRRHRAWLRTFTGAAIIAEDMVREKAMVDVACGRRRRTARESVARSLAERR